ncbi:MAG: trypsin-like peptidase domain-containing protein [Nitrospirota bacterium]|jgi:serine protease Do
MRSGIKGFLLMFGILILLEGSSLADGFPAVEVYEKTSKAVVLIVSQREGKGNMVGAGSIVSRPGIILTSSHVVVDKDTSRPYSDIRVYLKPDKVTGNLSQDLVNGYNAKVIAFDIDLDLAILKMETLPSHTEIIELANPEEIKIGEEVVAIGHPEQGGLWTLTYGRISGEILNHNNIQDKDVYQTDTSVNRGNSGGPLLDRRGYMVGINSNIARLGSGNLPITGVNFAIKSSVVKKWIEKQGVIIAYGKKSLHGDIQVVKTENEEIKVEDKKSAKIESSETPDDKILTPKRPYNFDDLFKEVEKEMEDMMEEMRGKIRKRE